VQGVGVIGIRCKRLPAAELSLELSSGLHMGKAGLVERRRVAYVRLVRCLGATGGRSFANGCFLGCSGGCPTLATIHWRISNHWRISK
jgi:hypothetical protein